MDARWLLVLAGRYGLAHGWLCAAAVAVGRAARLWDTRGHR